MKSKLSEICDFVKEKTDVVGLDNTTYISTENMLPNKGGIIHASTLPTTKQTQAFKKGMCWYQIFVHILKKYGTQSLMVAVRMMSWFLEQKMELIACFYIMS